jgi:hypothetical protein
MCSITYVRMATIVACICWLVAGFCFAQERSPEGQIFAELLPLVGLQEIQVEVDGFDLGNSAYNGYHETDDPTKELTGFSRAEHKTMYQNVLSRAKEVLRSFQIPVSESGVGRSLQPNASPILVVRVWWNRVPDSTVYSVRVDVQLLKQACLLKKPSEIVWAATWDYAVSGYCSKKELPSLLLRFVELCMRSFGEQSRRAYS